MSQAITRNVNNVSLGKNTVLIEIPVTLPSRVAKASVVISARAEQRGTFSLGHSFDVVVRDSKKQTSVRSRLSSTPACDMLPLFSHEIESDAMVQLVGTGGGVVTAEMTVLWPVKSQSVDMSGTISEAINALEAEAPPEQIVSSAPPPRRRRPPPEIAPLSAEDRTVCPVAPGQNNIVPIYRRGNRLRNTPGPIEANNSIMRVVPFG